MKEQERFKCTGAVASGNVEKLNVFTDKMRLFKKKKERKMQKIKKDKRQNWQVKVVEKDGDGTSGGRGQDAAW